MPTRTPAKAAPKTAPKAGKKKGVQAEPRLSRTRRPARLAVADWQTALRRQFGREQAFELENLGDEPVFSEFGVTTRNSGTRYRVAIRGSALGSNFCSCPDFATNDLGTCKHIEFTLAQLARRRGGKAALARGFQPPTARSGSTMPAQRQRALSAGSDARPSCCTQARKFVRRRSRLGPAAAALRRPGSTAARGAPTAATSCAATTMLWPSSPRSATPSAGSRRCAEAYPQGAPTGADAGC